LELPPEFAEIEAAEQADKIEEPEDFQESSERSEIDSKRKRSQETIEDSQDDSGEGHDDEGNGSGEDEFIPEDDSEVDELSTAEVSDEKYGSEEKRETTISGGSGRPWLLELHSVLHGG
jgi:hypothetical protein